MLFNRPDTPKSVPSRGTPHVTHVSWTHPTQHPKMHLDRFSRFYTQLTAESPYTSQCAINARLKFNRLTAL